MFGRSLLILMAAGAAFAASDPSVDGPFASASQTVNIPGTQSATLVTDVYFPGTTARGVDLAAGPCPVVVLVHGFAQSRNQHVNQGLQLATRGSRLYHLDEDFSEANDLAATMPEKLAAMKALFNEEAEKNHVYPLDDRGTGRIYIPKPSPGGSDPKRTKFTYYSGAVRLAETAAANTKNRSHTIEADLTMPEKGGEGVLVAIGGSSGGYSLYVQDGKLVYHFNWFDEVRTVITSSEPVPTGKSTVRFDFAYDGKSGELGKGGTGTLFINGKKVGASRIEKTVPGRFGIDTFGVGMDTGSPVSNTYQPPFAFTGTIHEVRVELK